MTLSLLGILIVVLMLGPVGKLGLYYGFTAELLTIYLWIITWFYSGKSALRVAMICGIILDLLGFLPFGVWTASLAGQVLLIDTLKKRILETSSLLHAIVALVAASVLSAILFSLLSRSLELTTVGLGILSNILLGLVLYYIFAVRLRLFARWAGRRIS